MSAQSQVRVQLFEQSKSHACFCQRIPSKAKQRRTTRRQRLGVTAKAAAQPSPAAEDPFAKKEVYHDGPINSFFIRYFSARMAEQLGRKEYAPGYDGIVELSKEIVRGRSSQEQQATVDNILASLLPPDAGKTFRKLFPFSQWSAELNARITMQFFAWLVGPMEMKDVEVDFKGEQQVWRSGVHIKKCRYLEQAECKGMCVNMCKMSTQKFFTATFGLPLTMVPNFEDLSCDMLYGQMPPPLEQDEAYMEPCFTQRCSIPQRQPGRPCPKIDTNREKLKGA